MSSLKKTTIAWILLIVTIVAAILSGNIIVLAESNTTNTSIKNTTLVITSPAELFINTSYKITANYSSAEGQIVGVDICFITKQNSTSSMSLNMTTGLYIKSTLYKNPGNYTINITCAKQGHQNQTKQFTLNIQPLNIPTENQTIDLDNDTYPENIDCNDNNPQINPGVKEKLYNSIDDDCNNNTLDYLYIDVSTNKQTYNPGETVTVEINATNGSDIYLTINTPTNTSYVYIYNNETYPITQEFTLTELSGDYTLELVNYYDEFTLEEISEFKVDDTFDVAIEVDNENPLTGDVIGFKVIPTGALGAVNLVWNLDDGTEKYTTNFTHTYNTARNYNIVLIATDQGGNQVIKTKTLPVKNKYILTVIVKDNSTNNIITDADVKLGSVTKNVNESGIAKFITTNNTYSFKVSSSSYYSYEENLKLNGSFIYTIKLNKDSADLPPIIEIITPQNNTVISKAEFKYKLTDNTDALCTLMISEGDGWWQEEIAQNATKNSENILLADLEKKSYNWKLKCIDDDDNIAYTKTYVVNISNVAAESSAIEDETPDTTYN
ncbi:MAG: PKD domain-containing protein, partial [Anaplasmataceae bacterium]|nr:PKD domain-containing protein [Anaplasmataceae bacterium]